MNTLALLLLIPSAGWAGSGDSTLLDWAQFGRSQTLEDAQPRGPELLHAGPSGRLALYDSVRREVVLFEDDVPAVSFPVHYASDLLLLEDGVLVLDHSARELSLWSLEGERRASARLGDLIPTAVTIGLEGDQLLAVDIFGHGHPVATLDDSGELLPPQARGLQLRTSAVRWDGLTMETQGLELDLPEAIKASGQRFGDWLVIDEVVQDAPLKVTRTAWHVPTRRSVPLPVEGRLYAPRGDLATTPEGELVVMVPRDGGLELLRVSP